MRRNYRSIFETEKSTAARATIFDWAPKFRDERYNTRYCLSQAFLRSHARCDKSTPFYTIARSEAKADLRVWLAFLSSFNGVYFFRNEIWENSIKLKLFTDAAGVLY